MAQEENQAGLVDALVLVGRVALDLRRLLMLNFLVALNGVVETAFEVLLRLSVIVFTDARRLESGVVHGLTDRGVLGERDPLLAVLGTHRCRLDSSCCLALCPVAPATLPKHLALPMIPNLVLVLCAAHDALRSW